MSRNSRRSDDAAIRAAEKARELLAAAAAEKLEVPKGRLAFAANRVFDTQDPECGMEFADAVKLAEAKYGTIGTVGSYSPPASPARYRGGGVGPQMLEFTWSDLGRAGFQRSVGIMNALNRNSRRAGAKRDIKQKGRVFYLRLFGLAYLHYGSLNRIGHWHPRKRLEIDFTG